MVLKVGILKAIPVTNCLDLVKANDADKNKDGNIDLEEATLLYAEKMEDAKLASIQDIYVLLGGAKRRVRTYACSDWAGDYGFGPSYTMEWQGDFFVEGYGCGTVNTRYNCHYPNDYTMKAIVSILFVVDCDMFAPETIALIDHAALVLGPAISRAEEGTGLWESVRVPLDVFIQPETIEEDRTSPSLKLLVADINREDLAELAGDRGRVSFFVDVCLIDGTRLLFEKEGVKWFEIEPKGGDQASVNVEIGPS